MASCCKLFLKVLTIFLVLLDIAVGWFKFYQMYSEISASHDHEEDPLQLKCENPDIYWYMYVVFETVGTILAVVEIYSVWLDIRTDQKLYNECFGKTFILILLIYLLSAFPSAILEIFYRDMCICSGNFSVTAWRDSVRDFTKGLLSGACVILLQILFHLTEIYTRLRRLGQAIKMSLWCCSYAPKENGSDVECRKGAMPCFIVSLLLALAYIAVFTTESVYVFCEPVH